MTIKSVLGQAFVELMPQYSRNVCWAVLTSLLGQDRLAGNGSASLELGKKCSVLAQEDLRII